MWPQLIWLAMNLLSLGCVLAKHGQPEKGNHNFFVSLVLTVLMGLLLYWGGFFDAMRR